ncbi:topoisomerase DNA-binding C4 zinc finger domain-containing protein [Bacillus mycoides]|uniref:topoisomerase DNA-binding C4 zinc finger domain-containing protein n=1 Tax=Bacillus mycoides TaxID=1405 RepID=UPI00273C219E|nr:topoisomerase DNA-binding C4 zinc finger domain-containing protein [Bacillus mycoides]
MNFREAFEYLDLICEKQNTNRILFNFQFNEMHVTGIYLSISKSILISCNNTNAGWVVESNEKSNINTYIPNDIFTKISHLVLTEEIPGSTTVKPFFAELKQNLMKLPLEKFKEPTSEQFFTAIGTTKTRDLKYDEKGKGERVFFKTWSRHVVNNVSPLNLNKTRRWFGKDIYEFCKENNISSVWMDIPSKNIQTHFLFLDPIKAHEALDKKKNTCPKCQQPLVVRNGKSGPFMGCSGFPDCRHTEDLKESTYLLSSLN